MSKESFSQKISEIMDKKINAIECLDWKTLLEEDENFKIAICLAYMSLSKEKIIDKEIKNDDRLGRLTPKVDTSEIDKLFKSGFATEMPRIIHARENDNLWILDNIRDSIMHGTFDIDEEKKIFIINNTQGNRELSAEIPFSWFIAYAKNDIIRKKTSNNYTIKNYYYNKNKKYNKQFETRKELINNILYRVNIYGNKFNIRDIENRINELFLLYSNEDISDEMIEEYKSQIDNEKIIYNKKNLVSFYNARQKVIDTITKEFPEVTINIFIDNRRNRFINKALRTMPKYFTDYDTMFTSFNNTLSPKGISLLRFISNIIENTDTVQKTDELKDKENSNRKDASLILHKLLMGDNYFDENCRNFSQKFEQDLKILRSIYLNIYGLSTLVINHETLYNAHFLNTDPSKFGINAVLKRLYLEFADSRKKLIMEKLDVKILLANKYQHLNNCKDAAAIKKIQSKINDLTKELNIIENDLKNLLHSNDFVRIKGDNKTDFQEGRVIEQYFVHFDLAKKIDDKKKIRKLIGEFLDNLKKIESKYTYGHCSDMKDVLTIIRNSFSHIGRIYIGKNNGSDTNIILNDYDTNGEKSGQVICKYMDLIELLKDPYGVTKQNKKHRI